MKIIKTWKTTGEIRCPKLGEWFISVVDGSIVKNDHYSINDEREIISYSEDQVMESVTRYLVEFIDPYSAEVLTSNSYYLDLEEFKRCTGIKNAVRIIKSSAKLFWG